MGDAIATVTALTRGGAGTTCALCRECRASLTVKCVGEDERVDVTTLPIQMFGTL